MPEGLMNEILAMPPIGPQTEPPEQPTESDVAFLLGNTWPVSDLVFPFGLVFAIVSVGTIRPLINGSTDQRIGYSPVCRYFSRTSCYRRKGWSRVSLWQRGGALLLWR